MQFILYFHTNDKLHVFCASSAIATELVTIFLKNLRFFSAFLRQMPVFTFSKDRFVTKYARALHIFSTQLSTAEFGLSVTPKTHCFNFCLR